MKYLEERIRNRAHEIWKYHRDTGTNLICDKLGQLRERTALDDWLEAEVEVIHAVDRDW